MYKINKLLKQNQPLFHTQDLALLWNITNKNTLYTTIKRYVQKTILYPVHKGLYSTLPLEQINPVKLGLAHLHSYAYLSTETVLAQAGIISQPPQVITLISSRSASFTIGPNQYRSRRLKDQFLYHDLGLNHQPGYPVASIERAVADLLYFNPRYHFDGPSLVDWKKVALIQKQVGYL